MGGRALTFLRNDGCLVYCVENILWLTDKNIYGARMAFYKTILFSSILILTGTISWAQDYDKGFEAYEAGDYATALKEWKPLADQGFASVQYSLAFMYDNGQGVVQDHKEAVKWHLRAANQGHVPAQYNLGISYRTGQGVVQDYKEAVKWYRRAADQGYAEAQFSLGLMYGDGKGVVQDYKEAMKWYRHAAIQGDAAAQFRLGSVYYMGEGIVQDYNLSHMWANVAAANGNETAGEFRDLIAKRMTSENIATAQSMARKCLESGYQECG